MKKRKWRRKIVLIAVLLGLLGMGTAVVYWKSILAMALTTTLATQYGLLLEYDDVHLALAAGGIDFHHPRILDTENPSLGLLARADYLDVGMNFRDALRGDVEVTKVIARNPRLDMKRLPDQSLQLVRVIERFMSKNLPPQIDTTPIPQSTISVASILSATESRTVQPAATPTVVPTAKAAKPSGKPTPTPGAAGDDLWPKIILNQAAFHYHVGLEVGGEVQVIRLEHLEIDPRMDHIGIVKSRVYRENLNAPPLLEVEKLDMDHLIGDSVKDEVGIFGTGVHLEGRETGKDQYDFNSVVDLWDRAIREIIAIFSPEDESVETPPKRFGSMVLKTLSAHIYPTEGNENSPSAVDINVDQFTFPNAQKEMTLNGVRVKEAGLPTVTVEQLVLGGTPQDPFDIQTISMSGVHVEIREDGKSGLNLTRAIRRVRSVVLSLMPKSGKTARAVLPDMKNFNELKIHNGVAAFYPAQADPQKITVGDVHYQKNTGKADVSQVAYFPLPEESPRLSLPILSATAEADGGFNDWSQILIQDPQIKVKMTAGGMDLISAATRWFSLPDRFQDLIDIRQTDLYQKPIRIRDLQILDADWELLDARKEKKIRHVFSPIRLQWSDLEVGSASPSLGALQCRIYTQFPSKGEFWLEGQASPYPLNLDGNVVLQVSDLTAYESYYEDSMPVGIEKAAIRLNSRCVIRDNQADCALDIILKKPSFTTEKGKWPVKIDARAAIASLNGLKDNRGDIYFRNNHLQGDIRDPQFKFGTGITEILGRNFWNRLTDIPSLPLDVAGTGVKMVKKTIRSVGGVVNKIIGKKKK